MDNLSKLRFWAKTTPTSDPGVDVFHHTRNVGYVARLLAEARRESLDRFRITPSEAAVMAAMHDVGKISQGFQAKCKVWLTQSGLEHQARSERWAELCEPYHDKVSQFSVARLLRARGFSPESADWWAVAPGSHHGHLHDPLSLRQERNGMRTDGWEVERQRVAEKLIEAFGEPPAGEIDDRSPALWWLAGLTTVADWIGSDERFFPTDCNPTEDQARAWAHDALDAIGFLRPEVIPGRSFEQLFNLRGADDHPCKPNDLQLAAYRVIQEPGVYVIEAPMGMGKTEAALWVAYRLLCEGNATGIYFALPTQVTSNRIQVRVADFVTNMCGNAESVRLIHANSWLTDTVFQPRFAHTLNRTESDADARFGRDWFASAKRALLAPFGVGTVDQALLSVVAAKHFFVRRFGLAGKVVVVDEVHSYDVYTGTLIRCLCEELLALGCTVILLSATLIAERRDKLIRRDTANSVEPTKEPYPLITGFAEPDRPIPPTPALAPEPKTVHLSFKAAEEALDRAWLAACDEASILWICDTVGEAQRTYERLLRRRGDDGPDVALLHSRFPYFRREALEDLWMKRLGKGNPDRRGCVLVSTQVVEQSVDVDADLLITELAPTDMLLQRIGRLWRHPRTKRTLPRAECWILAEADSLASYRDWSAQLIKRRLKPKGNVYAPYVLLRSWEVWTDRSSITLPSDIRGLIESTYCERDDEPAGWQTLYGEIKGVEYAEDRLATRSSNIWQVTLNDEEGKQTRLNDQPTVSLVLARTFDGKHASLLDGSAIELTGEEFDLSVARALHRNLVRTPKWVFERFESEQATRRYVRGNQNVAVVGEDGTITLDGLKPEVALRYRADLGVAIQRRRGEDDEFGI
ncbi:MAG: CRISPR-associated helicase Cas3' [Gemmatimonadaceae bacterium]